MPYSEFVSSDPSFEDMNAVVNSKVRAYFGFVHYLFYTLCIRFGFESDFWNYHFQKIRPSTSQFGWSSNSTVSKVSTLMKECWQANASARPPMLRAKKTLIGLKENLQEKISSEKEVICHLSPLKIANQQGFFLFHVSIQNCIRNTLFEGNWIYKFFRLQQKTLYSPIKDTYNLDKKESISTDSDNYSQNSSLTNSNPSQEMNVRYSWICKP